MLRGVYHCHVVAAAALRDLLLVCARSNWLIVIILGNRVLINITGFCHSKALRLSLTTSFVLLMGNYIVHNEYVFLVESLDGGTLHTLDSHLIRILALN